MKKQLLCSLILAGFISLQSCKKDDDETIIVNPPSEGSQLTINGGAGGANAVNSVYVDLSTDKQDSVKRAGWDLGFYSGADYRVIINNTTAATAKMVNKTDLTQITAADTTGFAASMALGQGAGTLDLIDDVDGDLTKTVIAAISANDADNKVYILKLSNGAVSPNKDWYKIRVLRNGAGYKLQYAKLSETSVKTIDVSKDAAYNFKYVLLDNNATVTVEPEKAKWDIQWTLTTYKTAFTTGFIPYTFSDYVYINTLGGTQVAEIVTVSTTTPGVTYDMYAEANISTTTFVTGKAAIGANWRTSAGPGGAVAGVRTDRFYVIKDPAGNVYKLKFISYTSTDGGNRGYPVITYKLVKKG